MFTLNITQASDVDGTSIILPATYEIFWATVVAIILWLALGKFIPRLYAAIDERREKIASSIRQGQELMQKADQIENEAKVILADAREKAREIHEDAQSQAINIIAQAKADAKLEAEQILLQAKQQIGRERKAVELEMKSQFADAAISIAEMIIQEQLRDPQLAVSLTDSYINKLDTIK